MGKKLISIIIFIFSVMLAIPAEAQELTSWSLPLPEGAKILSRDNKMEINGVITHMDNFISALSPKEILDFYKETLGNLGWQVKEDFASQGALSFTNPRGQSIHLLCLAKGFNQGPCSVLVYRSETNLELFTPPVENLKEAEDTSGHDLYDIPRYPQSRRSSNIHMDNNASTLVYESSDMPQEIYEFYMETLPSLGWSPASGFDRKSAYMVRAIIPANMRILAFNKGEDTLMILIWRVSSFKGNKKLQPRTFISISKNMQEGFSSMSGQGKGFIWQ